MQDQKPIEVKMLDGTILNGIATGNNAAWLCDCKSQQLLIGKTFNYDSPGGKVQCSQCEKIYRLYPEQGKGGKSVSHVKECES